MLDLVGEILMTLNINIDNFQGPFDLLLHLIKKNEMDIYDIKIHEITSQYMEYLQEMREIDLEITSEFIVIAATLLEIKSKLLLPKAKNEEEEEEKDPREELIFKLLEYKKFKTVANYLKQKHEESGLVFSKKPEIIDDKRTNDTNDILKGITMLELYNLFCKLMNNYDSKINHNNVYLSRISPDEYRVEDKMNYLLDGVKSKRTLYFSDIIKNCQDKLEMVVTFMALLELVKIKSIKIYQKSNFNDIFMERIENDEES